MWSSVYTYVPPKYKNNDEIFFFFVNKIYMGHFMLQTVLNTTADRKKINTDMMSTALKRSMHKPLASCMWIL